MLRTRNSHHFAFTMLLASMTPFHAHADDDVFEISVEASAGMTADSNVGVSDLDQNTGEGDIAAIFGAKLNLEAQPAARLVLRANYEFSQTEHQDFNAFDLQTHRGSAEAEYDFKAVKAGVLYNYVHARLGGDGFLDYQQFSPYISRLVGKRLFLRGAYAFTDKNFLSDNARDATGHAGQIDAFIFLDGLSRYVILGGELGGEDALDDQFDANKLGFKARFIQRLGMLGGESKLRAGLKFDRKDFTSITESIGEEREDEVFSADARIETPVYGPVAINLGYEYRDRASNLPSADFDEHVGEIKLVISY